MLKVCFDTTNLDPGYFIADEKEGVIIKVIESGLMDAPEVEFFAMNQEVDQGTEEYFRNIELHVLENDPVYPIVLGLYEKIRNTPLKSLNSKNNLVIERGNDGCALVFKKDVYNVCKDECHVYLGDHSFCKNSADLISFKNELNKCVNCEFEDIAYLLGLDLGPNAAKFPKVEICKNPNEEDTCIIADMNRGTHLEMNCNESDSLVSFTAYAPDMETCKQVDGFTNIQINVRKDNQIFSYVNELFNCYRRLSSRIVSGVPSDGKNHFTMKAIRDGIAFVFSRDMSLEGNPCECSIKVPVNLFTSYSLSNKEKTERQLMLNEALRAFYLNSLRCGPCDMKDIAKQLGIDLPKEKVHE